MTDEEIVAHILATRVPALWWHRKRPALGRDDVTSYLGGLPRLAPNLEWPRSGPANQALPLGAQIDCSQIPKFDGGDNLPRTGTLYFFVNVHVEDPHADIWGRVLYSPRLTRDLPLAPPPENPRLCYEKYYEVSGCDTWIDPEIMADHIPTRFDHWEIEPVVTGTFHFDFGWPTYSADDNNAFHREARRVEAIYRVVVNKALQQALGRTLQDPPPGATIASLAAVPPGYPWTWLFVLIHASSILKKSNEHTAAITDRTPEGAYRGSLPKNAQEIAAVLTQFAREADEWVMRALDQPTAETVGSADTDAFLGWLNSVEARISFASDWFQARDFSVPDLSRKTANSGSRLLIASVTGAEQMIPSEYMALSRYRADSAHFAFHQMLGLGKNTQGAADRLGKDHLLLLQLDSDYGMNWRWGDCGALQFWITPDDLAQRRFDEAVITMEGA